MSVIYQYGIGGNTLQSYKVKGKTMFENELVAKQVVTKGVNGHKLNKNHIHLLEFLYLVNGAFIRNQAKKGSKLYYFISGSAKLIHVTDLTNRTVNGIARLDLLTKTKGDCYAGHFELSPIGKQVCKMLFSNQEVV